MAFHFGNLETILNYKASLQQILELTGKKHSFKCTEFTKIIQSPDGRNERELKATHPYSSWEAVDHVVQRGLDLEPTGQKERYWAL